MDIKVLFLIGVVALFQTTLASELTVVTNRVFTANSAITKSCVVHEYAKDTVITNVAISSEEIALACCLAETYIRKAALKKYSIPRMQKDASGRIYMVAHNETCMFPFALPPNFEFIGLQYENLNRTVVPFVVTNEHLEGSLKGVLCEYKLNETFQFGLYVILNTYSVSPDFQRGVPCHMIVSRLGRFPFMEEVNVSAQEEFVKKLICRDCKAVTYERVTRLLAKKLLERAVDVLMKSLAEEWRMSWRTTFSTVKYTLTAKC